MRSGEMITLRQLVSALRGEIAWMRVYLSEDGRKQENCMSREQIESAVHAWGDRTVRRVVPGFGHVLVWLDRD